MTESTSTTVAPTHERITLTGRTVTTDSGAVQFGYPGVTLELTATGKVALEAHSTGEASYLSVQVDNQEPAHVKLGRDPQRVPLLEADGSAHTVKVAHLSETWHGVVTVENIVLEGGKLLEPPAPRSRRLLVIGDSVTCGEGASSARSCQEEKTARWWDSEASYGKRLGRALNADVHLVCYGGRGLTRSWNGSTEDMQAPEFFDMAIARPGGPRWNHDDFAPDLVLISLGTNDFSLGIGPLPQEDEFVETYVNFVQRILRQYPAAQVVLTEGAIVNDADDPQQPQKSVLRQYIRDTVAQLESPRVHQVLSEYYPGDDCDAHPTGKQHAAMANDLAPQLRHIMGW